MDYIKGVTDLFFASITMAIDALPYFCMFLVAAGLVGLVFALFNCLLGVRK